MNDFVMSGNVSLSEFIEKALRSLRAVLKSSQRQSLRPKINTISDIDIFLAYRRKKGGKDG